MLATTPLAASAPPATPISAASTDPIATAATGLNAQIEDDIRRSGDANLVSMATTGCKTVISGTTATWTIDWTKAEMVALEDTFVFVDAPPERLAIIGDASIPDQAAKLAALNTAMQDAATRCTPAPVDHPAER